MIVRGGGGFVRQVVFALHATVPEREAAAASAWTCRPRRRFLELRQRIPQRPACVAVIYQHLVKELGAESRHGPMKQITVARGQVPPAPALERMHQCYVED